jgi:DNA-binding transcriptional regulator GbsR (MarR family)
VKLCVPLFGSPVQSASDLAITIHHPTQTTKRALEDLAGLKLVEREKIKGVRGDHWSLTDETRIRLQQLPENIENDDIDEE